MSYTACAIQASSVRAVGESPFDWTKAGAWLIGIGAFLVFVAAVAGAPRPMDGGISFSGVLIATRERIWFAVNASGLASIAVGSVMLAISEFATWWFAGCTAVCLALFIYLLIVWKQHQYRAARLADQARAQHESEWYYECLRRCAKWRWALLHPLEDETWPRDCDRLPGAPEDRQS